MSKKKWTEEAMDWAWENFEEILEIYETPDFVEFIGKNGGDVSTYRYYKNGRIGAK